MVFVKRFIPIVYDLYKNCQWKCFVIYTLIITNLNQGETLSHTGKNFWNTILASNPKLKPCAFGYTRLLVKIVANLLICNDYSKKHHFALFLLKVYNLWTTQLNLYSKTIHSFQRPIMTGENMTHRILLCMLQWVYTQ